MDDMNMTDETPNNPSRRNFIKGVIAAGAQQAGWNAIDAVLLFLSAALLAGAACFFTLIRAAKPGVS